MSDKWSDKLSDTSVNSIDPAASPVSQVAAAGVARRRLIRAGLASAPVLMGLKGTSALATGSTPTFPTNHNCIKPSAFASVYALANGATLSHAPQKDWKCASHGFWKNSAHPAPYADKTKSFFSSKPSGAPSGSIVAGFANVGGMGGKTIQQVLEVTGGGTNALARHVAGCFLTAVKFEGQFIGGVPAAILTQDQCRTIWAGQGVWTPIAGGSTWTLAQTLAYFDYVFA